MEPKDIMNAPALYERCRPRRIRGTQYFFLVTGPDWLDRISGSYYVPGAFDYARHWQLEGPYGPEDRHE